MEDITTPPTFTPPQPSGMPAQSKTAGYLEIILGPMWSGKTSALLKIYRQYSFCKSQICVINYEADVRYSAIPPTRLRQALRKPVQIRLIIVLLNAPAIL